jgi:hypothetical protein
MNKSWYSKVEDAIRAKFYKDMTNQFLSGNPSISKNLTKDSKIK